jgi:Ca2+-binding RTX toxin-like protein
MSTQPVRFQPPLSAWRGEMVMADIAYRTPRLRGGMTAAQFRAALQAADRNRIPIPSAGFSYGAAEISTRFRVIATTNDDGVIRQLGSDGHGGTRTGFQAVILQDVNTNQYFLSVAGVTDGHELLSAHVAVLDNGFHYPWARDLVGLINYAEGLQNVSNMSFVQTWGHSGAQSAIFGADVFLHQTRGYRPFAEVVTFQGLGPNASGIEAWRALTHNGTLRPYGYTGPLPIPNPNIPPAWYNALHTFDSYYGPGADQTNNYVDVRVGADFVSRMGDDDFGVTIAYRYGTDPRLTQGLWMADPRLPLGQPRGIAPINDHFMTTVWGAADIPENNVADPDSGWISPPWFQRISLEFTVPEIRIPPSEFTLPYWDGERVTGFETYAYNAQGQLKLKQSFHFTLKRDSNGDVVLLDGNPLITGDESVSNGLTVARTYVDPIQDTADKPTIADTDILIPGNPFGITFSDVGAALGSQLGYLIAGRNQFTGVLLAGTLETIGDSLGDLLDGLISGGSLEASATVAFSHFARSLGVNIAGAGIGAVSSLITAEIVRATGLSGFPAELFNSAAGSVLNTLLGNLAGLNGTELAAAPFSNLTSAATLGAAVGSFLGAKLAAQVVSFDSVGGQLGAAVGTSLGVIAAGKLLSIGGLLGGPIGAAIGAFAGYIIGGMIGSLFGGTPRSGADVQWDPQAHEFVTANVYARKGGSKDTAQSLASAVAETLNGVLEAAGGTLLAPELVQAGNYGMRKSDFVYRPVSTRDKDAITRRFTGKTGAERLISYGVYAALSDADFQIAGGDVYVKRAVYNTFALGATEGSFDASTVVGNIVSAQQYRKYSENQLTINAVIAADPHGVLAMETALTISRAVELGLTRRHASDWYGGFTFLMKEGGTNAANVGFTFEYDQFSDRVARTIGVGGYLLADEIDVAGQTRIEGTAGADTISLPGSQLAAASAGVNAGLKVNGAAHDGSALEIGVAATVDAGEGDDFVQASDRGDNIFGGSGNDTLYGGRLDDWLFGGEGNDVLHAGSQAGGLGGDGNYLDGAAGDDQVYGGEGSDWIEGGEGTDLLDGGGGDDILAGGGGALDMLKGGHGDDQYLVRLGDGADEADEVASGVQTSALAGGSGDLVRDRYSLLSTAANRHLRNWFGTEFELAVAEDLGETAPAGAPGTVAVSAAGGEDAIVFGQGIGMGDVRLFRPKDAYGNDLAHLVVQVMQTDPATGVESFSGTQLLVRDWFTNTLKRVEWLKFADGNEIRIADVETFIVGTGGDDILNGTSGRDFVYGGGGNDHIHLYAGDDIGSGGSGDDAVWGDEDRDLLIGGLGSDKLYGGTQDDMLSGDAGDDELMGEEGNDTLSGGRGSDTIVGGAGSDTIRFARGDGRDTIVVEPTTAMNDAGNIAYWETVWTSGDSWLDRGLLEYDYHYDWFDIGSTRQLRRYVGSVTTVYSASDTIEFDLGIDIQDIRFARSGADLTLVVGNENDGDADLAAAADTVTIRGWYDSADPAQWGTQRPVGRFAFYQTGILEAATESWTLIAGGAGADGTATAAFAGTAGKDWITGGGGDDVVDGGDGDDILNGNSGFDELRGGAGSDVLYGGGGDDVLTGGIGADILVGGDGSDTASYAGSAGVTANLGDSSRNSGDAADDVYSAIENLTGGDGADSLTGDSEANILEGGLGSDTLQGQAGDDVYVWNAGDGADTIIEGVYSYQELIGPEGALPPDYTVTAEREPMSNGYSMYDLSIDGPLGNVYQRHFTSRTNYGPGRIDLWPSDGWNLGFAPTGNGKQVARTTLGAVDGGNDTIELGEGISLADLTFQVTNGDLVIGHNASGAQLTVRGQFGAGGYQRVEKLQFADGQSVSIANVLTADAASPNAAVAAGSTAAHLIAGDGAANVLDGAGGDDALSGAGGDDSLHGGGGNDVLEGGAGADVLDGGANGSAADDPTGWGDTARYAGSQSSVWVELADSGAGYGMGGDAEGDTLIDIENVVGSNVDQSAWGIAGDHLAGNSGGNRLFGLGGNDDLSGLGGDDVLVGGAGNDTLSGGDGDDNLDGGDGDDSLVGGYGSDTLVGGAGNDFLQAGSYGSADPASKTTLDGGAGNDILYGADGSDILAGGDGDDQLSAGSGDDVLDGGAGNDVLEAGYGSNVLAGGAGDDILQGGYGDDSYLFDASSGSDEIVEMGGANRIVFSGVSADQLWLTQSGYDLNVRVLGEGGSSVTVRNYFASPDTTIKEIVAGESSIFPKYATALIQAMTAAAVPQSPGAVPQAIAEARDALWVAGGKSAPIVADQSYTMNERSEPDSFYWGYNPGAYLYGQVSATDYDENVTGYAVTAGPAKGELSLSGGSWSYRPNVYANGTDSFRIRVTDADGHSADQQVTVSITPVNSRPYLLAAQPAFSIREDAIAGTVVGTLLAADPEGDAVNFLGALSTIFAVSSTGEITLRSGLTLDYETSTVAGFRARLSDGSSVVTSNPIFVSIVNLDERPDTPVPLAPPVAIVSQGSIGGTQIADFSATDPEGAAVSYRLRSGSTQIFQLTGNRLSLAAGLVFDFQTEAAKPGAVLVDRDGDGYQEIEFTAQIESFDGGQASAGAATVTVGIEDTNSAPTAINLGGAATVAERDHPQAGASMAAVSIGTLSAVDADARPGEVHVFQLIDPAGAFEIANGNQLRLKAGAALDYETAAVDGSNRRYVDVSVKVTDRGGAGKSLTQAVRVYISDAADYLYGTTGADQISGAAGTDIIYANAGNDVVAGGAGDDQIFGEAGDDQLSGGSGNDALDGGLGNDILYGDDGNDNLTGGDGADRLEGGLGNDILSGGLMADTLLGGDGADTLRGDDGDDLLTGGLGADTLIGGTGFDQASYADSSERVIVNLEAGTGQYGTAQGDTLAEIERVLGSAFDDQLTGSTRAETLDGGAGADTIDGAAGDDILYGGDGNDGLTGGAGIDRLEGGAGIDTLNGGDGDDTVFGQDGNDTLLGGAGGDTLDGGAGLDSLDGGDGNDTLYGGADNDTLSGGLGVDRLEGGAGDDTLDGGAGADALYGGAGNDVLTGGGDADTMEGGAGDDRYLAVEAGDLVTERAGEGIDEVQTALADYTLGAEIEKLTGTSATGQTLRGNASNNVIVAGSGNDTIVLETGGGTDAADGGAGDDIFTFGATWDASDTVTGGAGTDSITIQGNYNLTLGASSLNGLEGLLLLSNANTAAFNSYTLALNDANVAAGGYLVVNASLLRAGETLTLNAAAETNGYVYTVGGASTENVTGGSFTDIFYYTQGMLGTSDVLVGGGGWDTLYFAGGVTATLSAGTISGVEQIAFLSGGAGTSYNITTNDANVVAGAQLNVYGDFLVAGEFLTFNGSAETNGSFWMTGGASNDTVIGGMLGDTMASAAGNDTLSGGGGNDRLDGGDGDDVLEGGAGADALIGGAGTDRATYANSAAGTAVSSGLVGGVSVVGYTKDAIAISLNGVRVDLQANSSTSAASLIGGTAAAGADAQGDWFYGIENLTGSGYNDSLRGTANSSEIRGGAGDDLIYGGNGDDRLYGDAGNDVLYGEAGMDKLWGGADDDRLFGGGEQDELYGEGGADILAAGAAGDTLDGGAGNDTLIGGDGGDTYVFGRGGGGDTIYNYDDDGAQDAVQFADNVVHTDLWFKKTGRDLLIKILGTTDTLTVKDWFVNTTAGDYEAADKFYVDALVSGARWVDHQLNVPALLALMKDEAEPASFGALSQTLRDKIDSAWRENTAPTIAAFATNPVSTGEGVFIDLKFTIADGQSPPASLKLTYGVTSGIFQTIQATDWTYDPADERVRTLRLRPVVDSHGLATLTINASDWNTTTTYTTSVRLLARADPILMTAPISATTTLGTTVMLPGTVTAPNGGTGGRVAAISDWNSEIFDHLFVENIPVGATLSDGVNSFTATATARTATINNWNLAALRVTPAAGSATDFTMTLRGASRENLQPFEIVPGETVGPESTTTIKVVVNAPPTSVGLRGTGMAATPSVNEYTPTTNPNGAIVGVAVAVDPDSPDLNKISTDFNLLPKAGAGEERIVTATGPTGTQVQVLETGQFAGLGGDASNAGGGVYGASAGAPDTTKAYKYTVYVKAENALGHNLYIGAIGQVENATTGAADANPYFIYSSSTGVTQDRWYRVEGWVLPAGHALVGGDVFGGVFDTVTGAKIANTTPFRFAPGATDTGIRFFSYYGQANAGYSAQWYLPQVEKLDTSYSLIDSAGGRFAINAATGLVTATGTNFDYETAAAHNITVRATDATGLSKDQVIAVGVNNINEKPNPILLASQTLYSETFAGDTPHYNQSIARFTMTDPDGTTPALTIVGGNPYNWFTTVGNQLTFAGSNFSADWLHQTMGQYGQDSTFAYDTDGDGLMEVRVATLTLASVDSGGLQSNPFTYNVLIEDKLEAPVFSTTAYTFGLNENPAAYQYVGQVSASDPDGPAAELRYHFTSGTYYYDSALARHVVASPDGRFVVDLFDGRVWTKGTQALDYEGLRNFSYSMTVYDKNGTGSFTRSTTSTLNINLQNVNERPNPLALQSATLHSETLPADPSHAGQSIARFTMGDPDGTTPSLTILGGNPYGWFGTSGNQLIFSTANFSAGWLRSYAGQYGTDAAWSYDTDNDGLKEIRVATLTLAATDAGGLQGDPFTYNVLIEDKNEAPVFTANPYNFSVAENSGWYQYVGTVAASDVDGPAGELRYTFAGRQWYSDGNLGRTVTSSADGRFVMDFLDGRVWKAGSVAIDYESTPAFSYQVATYDRNLGANTLSAASTLNIGVQNVNDNAPAQPTVQSWGTTAFNENTGAGYTVAVLNPPADADGALNPLGFQLTANPDNLFEIVGQTLRIRTDRAPNYEAFASGGAATTVQVRFRTSDGAYASAENAINVTIYNTNDIATWFTQIPTTFTVTENTAYGTIVSDGVRAADSDGFAISYSIDPASNPNGAFGINAAGQITIANGVDYEAANWLSDASGKYANLRILASDGGAPAEAYVQVRIANQVLTVVTAGGGLTSRYRHETSTTNMGGGGEYYNEYPNFYGGGGGGYYGGYSWYTEDRYVDVTTGAVVMRDGAYGNYPNTTNRPLPDPNYWQLAEGFRRTGNGYELISDDEYNSYSLAPIVFDLGGAGLDHAFGQEKVAFDVDGDGKGEPVRWIAPEFAFLAFDRDGDGRIGSGLEISFTQDKPGAKTDLEGLAAFDSNHDGSLSAADLRFGEFLLWQDANSDGVSQAGELRTLTEAGIVSLSLAGTPTGRTFANTDGNVILNSGSFTFADGRKGTIGDAALRATLADAAAAAAAATPVNFVARDFARSSRKYLLSVDGGTLSIVPAKAKGTLDPRAGEIGPATMLGFPNRSIGILAPVVLDLDGDGIELKSMKKAHAHFDMNGDGGADDTGWIGKGDGLLVIDRNGDGRIGGANEISFLSEKSGAKSDLDALSALDSNHDGKIDKTDARFAELKIWVDGDGDGVTDGGELNSLADHDIESIGLAATANRQTAKLGDNIVISTGVFTRSDGSTGTLADAALAFRPGRVPRIAERTAPEPYEGRLEALRAGLDGPFSSFERALNPFQQLAPAEGPQPLDQSEPANDAGLSAGIESLAAPDRLTALMAQEMAAFGTRSGETEWQLRERQNGPHFDYFAQ